MRQWLRVAFLRLLGIRTKRVNDSLSRMTFPASRAHMIEKTLAAVEEDAWRKGKRALVGELPDGTLFVTHGGKTVELRRATR